MNDEANANGPVGTSEGLESPQEIDITEAVASSPVFARLVEEVRNEQVANRQPYNRMHNRHNRSR